MAKKKRGRKKRRGQRQRHLRAPSRAEAPERSAGLSRDKTGSKTDHKPGDKADHKPGDKADHKTGSKTDHKPGDKAGAAAPPKPAAPPHPAANGPSIQSEAIRKPGPAMTVEPVALSMFHAGPTEHISLDELTVEGAPSVTRRTSSPGNPAIPVARQHVGVSRRRSSNPALRPLMWRGFVQGMLIGLLVVIPAVAFLLYCMARWALGNEQAGLLLTLSKTAGFAGLPAGLLSGIIGAAAVRGVATSGGSVPSQAIKSAIMSTATVGVGASLLAAAVLRYLPRQPLSWLGLMVTGAVAGALGGMVLSTWVSGVTAKHSSSSLR